MDSIAAIFTLNESDQSRSNVLDEGCAEAHKGRVSDPVESNFSNVSAKQGGNAQNNSVKKHERFFSTFKEKRVFPNATGNVAVAMHKADTHADGSDAIEMGRVLCICMMQMAVMWLMRRNKEVIFSTI